MIELRDVFRVHRTPDGDAAALQGISLNVGRGEHLCVLGPSGAGKSTLLRVIAGLEPSSAGVVSVLGHDVGRLSGRARAGLRRASIGFLDQRAEHNLPPDLPVRDGIVLALGLRGAGRAERRLRAGELLEAVGLGDRAAALPAELSGGERQRLALCAALAHRPALLLADEPTGELDEASATAVRALIAGLATTVIVASHDPASAVCADRCVRLHDGRVAEEERRGDAALVVGRGGWVRLPGKLLSDAGIAGRATARPDGGAGITLHASGPPPPAAGRAKAAPDPAPGITPQPSGPPATGVPRRVPARRLECRALTKAYGGRRVIPGLSFAFAPGRLTVVTGRSGAGKSTLLRLLAGIEPADAGEVALDGVAFSGDDADARARLRREAVGFAAQEVLLVPFLSAEENVRLALALRGTDTGPQAAQALARLGLAERAGQRVSRLSAGERQRVALARALATAQGILLVDEPTSRLDAVAAGQVARALTAAAAEGQTVVCATHEPGLIAGADHRLTL